MSNTFLKWAGGKRWFVNRENRRFPAEYNRYIDPFLGGGAVFFYLEPQKAILSDINSELINTYIAVRDDIESVYHNLRMHARSHCREYFYQVRDKRTRTLATSAARMIYLNKSCRLSENSGKTWRQGSGYGIIKPSEPSRRTQAWGIFKEQIGTR